MLIGLGVSEANCVWAVRLPLHDAGDTGGEWGPRPSAAALSEPVVTLHVNEANPRGERLSLCWGVAVCLVKCLLGTQRTSIS